MAIIKDDGKTRVVVLDDKGQGGAHHEYKIVAIGAPYPEVADIDFQNGPIKEFGTNGCTQEDLLRIVEHRLECFQEGDFKCRENAIALTKVQEAMHWLNHRTADRIARGVEGVNKK